MPMLSRSSNRPARPAKAPHYLMGHQTNEPKHIRWSLCGFPFDLREAKRAWGERPVACRRCLRIIGANAPALERNNSAHLQRDGGA